MITEVKGYASTYIHFAKIMKQIFFYFYNDNMIKHIKRIEMHVDILMLQYLLCGIF